jgi:glutamate N-acetyltransferase/amino-acid N-acetyltransferase
VRVSGADDQSARQIARTIAAFLSKIGGFRSDSQLGTNCGGGGPVGQLVFHQEDLQIKLGDFVMMENGQPLAFDRARASNYLKAAASGTYLREDTVLMSICIGNGSGTGTAWGCDLSYDYVKINAEYTT